jgi:hypothetical protein
MTFTDPPSRNCMAAVDFDPPFSTLRREAIEQGHVNLGSKVHFEVARLMNPWVSLTSPASDATLPTAFSDHGSDENTYAIAFGYAESQINPNNPSAMKLELSKLLPADQQPNMTAYLTHDWKNDPFAKGAWVAYAPSYMLKFQQELQRDHGRIIFASADWVDGWRGFVDGAIAAGKQSARRIIAKTK